MPKLPKITLIVALFSLVGWASVAGASPSFRKPTRMVARPGLAISQPNVRDIPFGSLWIATPPKSWGTQKVTSFASNTSLGKLFQASATIVSDHELSAALLLGKPVVIGAELASGRQVLIHGYVGQISTSTPNETSEQFEYQIEIESWLRAMTRSAHFRVFHNQTAPEILEDLFSHYETASYRIELSREYPIHETMFQYRETDFNFAQRLMEHVGIYYHWEHSERGHVLVLRDTNSLDGAKQKTTLKIADIVRLDKVDTNVYSITDFNLRTPEANLAATTRAKRDGVADLEVEDFEIGSYRTSQEARWYSRVRLDESRAGTETISANMTDGRILNPGVLVDVGAPPISKQTYLVTESNISAFAPPRRCAPIPASECGVTIAGRISAIPVNRTFRPLRNTPWPQISGTLVATVLETTTGDGVTRCKLQFPWVTIGGARGYLWGVADPTLDLNKGDYVNVMFVDGSPAQPVVTAIVRSSAREVSRR